MQLIAVLLLVVLSTSISHAQSLGRKKLPTLTLIKTSGNPNTDVLSDPVQYVSEAGPGEKRFFLLPVFFKNCLDPNYDPSTGYPGEPIYSFRFKLQYNRTLLRAVGVQKRGPLPQDTYAGAADFNFSWDIDQDASYKTSTTGSPSSNGERIMVTASSSTPLPRPTVPGAPPNQNSCQFRDTAVLVYVVFEVVGNSQGTPFGATRDQLILTRDSMMFNNYSVTNVDQNMIDRGFDFNQEGVAPSPVFPITYPNNYGTAIIEITQRPRIDLLPQSQVVRLGGDPSNYVLTSPLQTTFGNNNFISRNILLFNGIAGTELRNLSVETDQPWLRVDLNTPPQQGGTPPDRGVYIRKVTGQQTFNVIVNPAMLPSTDPGFPVPGLYVGYVTIRSEDAVNSAVRLRVPLLITRNPLESGLDTTQEAVQTKGIRLTFRNSQTPTPDTTYLTFGTGIGARDSVDQLFGEMEAATAPVPGSFYARFFPPALDSVPGVFKGLIDTRNVTPLSSNNESSIDIRNFRVNKTHVYCVRFDAGSPANYPVIIEYDTRDFPVGAQLFIRDNVNGTLFNTDLRNATVTGATTRSFAIRDPQVKSFCIEYTLPAVVQFPEVQRGWNFVSLPVRPSDPRSGVVFPNIASGKPLSFSQNQYFGEDTVRVGVGYFVKYGSVVDRTIAGVQIREIGPNPAPGYPVYLVRVFEGWNTVGGLSAATNIDLMSFAPYLSGGIPKRASEVYRYVTDRGYEQTAVISPGFGYWVKVDRDGYYELKAPPGAFNPKSALLNDPYSVLNRLTIADNGQKHGTAYFGQSSIGIDNGHFELPPLPAADMFDVRFQNNGFVSASQDVAAEHIVHIQGAQYPVVLSVDNADADYVVTDAATGQVLGTFKQGHAGAVRITNSLTKSVKITGVASSEMSLSDAFPNPTSGTAMFSFSVPTEQKVTIGLFNTIGTEVRSLFNGTVTGKQTFEVSTEGLVDGVYYYKMTTADGFSQVRRLVIAR
jgi:hypothetical protein